MIFVFGIREEELTFKIFIWVNRCYILLLFMFVSSYITVFT